MPCRAAGKVGQVALIAFQSQNQCALVIDTSGSFLPPVRRFASGGDNAVFGGFALAIGGEHSTRPPRTAFLLWVGVIERDLCTACRELACQTQPRNACAVDGKGACVHAVFIPVSGQRS